MSELNPAFFQRLANKLPGMKAQVAKAAQARKACRNGTCGPPKPICGICGAQFGIKTALVLGAPIPKFCPPCNEKLEAGCGAFVTLEKPARYWIGAGVHAQFVGKVSVISAEQMDVIQRAMKYEQEQEQSNGTSTGTELPPAEA